MEEIVYAGLSACCMILLLALIEERRKRKIADMLLRTMKRQRDVAQAKARSMMGLFEQNIQLLEEREEQIDRIARMQQFIWKIGQEINNNGQITERNCEN